MSGLKRTHDWIRDDEKVYYLGLKKNFRLRRAPSSEIFLSGRRGLIVVSEHTHDMVHAHIVSI